MVVLTVTVQCLVMLNFFLLANGLLQCVDDIYCQPLWGTVCG